MGMVSNSSSSSSSEDGDEEWKAAINSVASPFPTSSKPDPKPDSDDDPLQPQPLKHYQLKAQKTLDDILEKSLFMVKDSDPVNADVIEDDPVANGDGVRLFKQAPVGILFDHRVELKGPTKKPRILPGEAVDEKSKKFKKRLRSVAVEGADILAAAESACQKAKARLKAREAATREAAKREEERVAELKKIRGERWLPSMAKQMQLQRADLKTGPSK
ncbi:hypothetical protein RND81_13G189900 [Saponaria officinalis]|uniref:Uncharacterized protein n=1 Tax=Saponaria officinalis TaxID=3572 RepID=A0AAW1H2N1_SAPOF